MNRPIRSYVLRQGRTSAAQRRALDALSEKYAITFAPQPIDARAVFGRAAPLVLEIGSGMGETTAAIARSQPESDFIAIEVHGPGVGSLLNRIEADRIANLRVIRHDAVEVLEHMIADASLAGIHLFFPDPWPKKRHHKRRLVQPAFTALAARKLAPGGYLHAATDWPDYAAQMLAVFSAEPLLANQTGGYAPRPERRPLTKFERRGLGLGHAVHDLLFRRRQE
ncbi:MAG: tRNA (guanosine(46)-N7)-methyltransferase TrmB [Betaproteobacteria bacterium]|nr:MAG: tRNA (guanosine(46)-N7)-methyltransferase TrmB [Betaproteobacteria bacterium]